MTNSLDQLATVARDFRKRGIEILAINGGDGTISRTLTAFIHEYKNNGDVPLPQIALLRGGTINVLAGNLGIRGTPEQVLFRLVEMHSRGENIPSERIRTLVIDGNFGFLFGNGTAASFLKVFYQNKTGPVGAVLLIARLYLASIFNKPLYESVVSAHEMTLRSGDREPLTCKSIAVMASSVERGPLGIRVFAKARRGPHAFQALAFVMDPERVPLALPSAVLRQGEGEAFGKLSVLSDALTVHCKTSPSYTLDGELFDAKGEEISIGTGPTLEFLRI